MRETRRSWVRHQILDACSTGRSPAPCQASLTAYETRRTLKATALHGYFRLKRMARLLSSFPTAGASSHVAWPIYFQRPFSSALLKPCRSPRTTGIRARQDPAGRVVNAILRNPRNPRQRGATTTRCTVPRAPGCGLRSCPRYPCLPKKATSADFRLMRWSMLRNWSAAHRYPARGLGSSAAIATTRTLKPVFGTP